MDMKERFNKAFAYLQGKQIIKGQKDLAEKLGATPGNISKALSGDKSALTNNLMKRFCAAFPGMFNLRWLILGEGEMLQAAELPQEAPKIVEVDNGKDDIIKSLLNQNTALLSTINRLADELAGIKEEIKRLRTDAPIHSYSLPSDDVKATLNDPKEAY